MNLSTDGCHHLDDAHVVDPGDRRHERPVGGWRAVLCMTEDDKQQRLKAIRAERAELDRQDRIPHQDRDPNSTARVEDVPSPGMVGREDRARRRAELHEELRKLSE
jgi:hypothetical protein